MSQKGIGIQLEDQKDQTEEAQNEVSVALLAQAFVSHLSDHTPFVAWCAARAFGMSRSATFFATIAGFFNVVFKALAQGSIEVCYVFVPPLPKIRSLDTAYEVVKMLLLIVFTLTTLWTALVVLLEMLLSLLFSCGLQWMLEFVLVAPTLTYWICMVRILAGSLWLS